jgi:uncharacterized membrane protein YhfC
MDIVVRILNFTIMMALPLGLAIFLARRYKAGWRLFGVGVGSFIVSQVFHIPFNRWVLEPVVSGLGLSLSQEGLQLAAVALLYGLSAGLFEEITRALGYRFFIKEKRDWVSGLMYGAGHGGIEAILVGALALAAFVQIMALRGADLSSVIPPDQVDLARSQIEAYWAMPWYQAILGAVERLSALPVQVSLSILVLQVFRRKRAWWLGLAIGWHTLVDAVAVFAMQTWNVYITEAIVAVFGLASIGIILALKPDSVQEEFVEAHLPLTMPEIRPVAPSGQNLEDSRYESTNE